MTGEKKVQELFSGLNLDWDNRVEYLDGKVIEIYLYKNQFTELPPTSTDHSKVKNG